MLPPACPDIPLGAIPSNTRSLPSLNLNNQAARAYKTVSWTNTSSCVPYPSPPPNHWLCLSVASCFRFSLHVATCVKSPEWTSAHLKTKQRRKKTYTDDPKAGLDPSTTFRGRDNDIRFYEHLLTGSHEQTSQFIIHYQFFLNSMTQEKWFTGTEKRQFFPELTVDSDSSAVERNTLYVVPIDLVWSSTQKMRFHLPHWILSALPQGNPPPYSRQKLYYCSLLWKIQHSFGQFALWRQTIWHVWLIFQTKTRVLCNKNARSTVKSR